MTQLFDDTSDVSVGGGVAETNISVAFDFCLDQLRRSEERVVV